MPDPVLATLDRLREELDAANAGRNEYVLFGSAVLYLHGLRDTVGDVDLFVSRGVWADWVTVGAPWHVRTPRADDPAFLASVVTWGALRHLNRIAWIRHFHPKETHG